MAVPMVVTTLLAYNSTIFICSDETSSKFNYLLIIRLIGQNFGSQLPTNSRFWPDRPSFGGRFHKLSLDPSSLTFYQPMVELTGHSDHFHLFDQLTILVKLANFQRWSSQTKSKYDLSNMVLIYGRVFWSF